MAIGRDIPPSSSHPLAPDFMITVTFALPEESREFRGLLAASTLAARVRVSHSGAGPAAAGRHVELELADRPEMLIATGFAGGLDPALRVGDVVVATNFSAPTLLARARELPGVHAGALASVEWPVESVAAKRALADQTGAIAVDMETAPVAAACARAGVPLLAVRVISDPADEPLPVPFAEWFDLARQRPRPARLVAYLARHPSRIVPFARFVRGLAPARRALAAFLLPFVSGAE
jgi:adenosylhomocysteine nucleosidase